MKWYKIDRHLLPQAAVIKKIKVAGKNVCLIHGENQYYATGSTCPHAGADLSKGWCANGRLVCPYHRHAFDLLTGRGDPGQGNYISTYPLAWRNDELYIGLPLSWIKRLFGSK
ncbi:hypothetical protein GCM10023231_23920 [Olivibacter ginsenosidimutans]|uniref:Rieske domain-containing protein n=2 Tax=Olivibacter ginsenosidimutans TaxID=1176537 RepID=A0ABP9BF64_9SPHI